MIGFDEALALTGAAAKALGKETVPLDQAAGRVLASPVVARIDSPRSDVSAMDGYAVRDSDLSSPPASLRIVGKSFAGGGFDGAVRPGECVRIFTGAPVPAGADRVVMQENVRSDGDEAIFEAPPGASHHIRQAGSDFRVGDILVEAGRLLGPRAVVAVAAADVAQIDVNRRPTVQILGTGDELVQPGTAASQSDRIPESVSLGVAAMVDQWGGCVGARKRLRDEVEELESAGQEAVREADLVVVTGGASVGEKDFAKAMFEPAGLELLFSKVAIKPGKPVWLGRAGETLVLGLPGNPTSALVTARLFLLPLLAAMTGRNISEVFRWRSVPLAAGLPECGPRETFHRGRWTGDAVEPLSFQDSSAQKALAQADVLIRQRANTPAMAAGDEVQVLDF